MLEMYPYNEKFYWNRRGNPNTVENDQTAKHISFVRKHINPTDRILDFGSGIGRILPAYYPSNKITFMDISSEYMTRLIARCKDMDIVATFILNDVIIPDKVPSCDTVVCVSVLLHTVPENVEKLLKIFVENFNKAIVISAYDPDADFDRCRSQEYCYNHDYPGICERNGWKMEDVKNEDGSIYFVVSK